MHFLYVFYAFFIDAEKFFRQPKIKRMQRKLISSIFLKEMSDFYGGKRQGVYYDFSIRIDHYRIFSRLDWLD
jgi:hypothetical protein